MQAGKKRMQLEKIYDILILKAEPKILKIERNSYGENQKKIKRAGLHCSGNLDILGNVYAYV